MSPPTKVFLPANNGKGNEEGPTKQGVKRRPKNHQHQIQWEESLLRRTAWLLGWVDGGEGVVGQNFERVEGSQLDPAKWGLAPGHQNLEGAKI